MPMKRLRHIYHIHYFSWKTYIPVLQVLYLFFITRVLTKYKLKYLCFHGKWQTERTKWVISGGQSHARENNRYPEDLYFLQNAIWNNAVITEHPWLQGSAFLQDATLTGECNNNIIFLPKCHFVGKCKINTE